MNIERIQNAVEAAKNSCVGMQGRNRIEEVQLYFGDNTAVDGNAYAEPGYSGEVVAVGDWNKITKWNEATSSHTDVDTIAERLGEVLEKLGVEIEWNDEWTSCGECNKLVRTSADGYEWTKSYYVHEECEIVCTECVNNDPESYLEHLEGNSDAANTIVDDLTEHGYVLVEEEYQNGLYGGQTDSPANIAEALEEKGITRFIFQLDAVRQFDASFSVYVHESEANKIGEDFEAEPGKDPAIAMKQGLEAASAAMKSTPKEGIQLIKVGDGVAEVRTVSAEEFIKGVKL